MITMKFQHNFQQVTRQRDLPNASQNYEDWMATIKYLFDKLYDEFKGDSKPLNVRRLGVRVSKFKNEELENIKEDQRIKVLKVSDVNDLPPANMGVHRKDKTYECPMCGNTISLEERNDHEVAHKFDTKWNKKPKEGAHISSSSSMRTKFAKKEPLQGKRNRQRNHHHRKSNSKLKPVVIPPDGSSKKTKRAVAPIDKQKNWRKKIPDRNQTRLK